MARAVPPDVAVVNIALLAGDGLRTIARLTAEQPRCATLVLAGPDESGRLGRALDVHVRGVVGTQAAPCELVRGHPAAGPGRTGHRRQPGRGDGGGAAQPAVARGSSTC